MLKYVSQILIAVHLLGTGTAQVIACAGNNYSIDHSHSKRSVLDMPSDVLHVLSL